jgi:signal transduction histidine kinase/ActR/RegA family two-component response regulator
VIETTSKPNGVLSAGRKAARFLPRGWTLPDEAWKSRHRGILIVLWSHVVAVPVFGFIRGYWLPHVLAESSLIAALATIASYQQLPRRWRMIAASIGLLTASAVLVHLSGGSTEMHFHFFVMVPLIALYQDWVPFLLAISYVVLHHGVVGSLDPHSVFSSSAAIRSPWKWAGIHAFFITGISIVCLVTWRLLERALNEAKAEAHTKSEFLSVMSHEIRTPLTSVIGYTGLLLDTDLSEEQRTYANTVRRSSDHLLTLINDILDYSRIDAGALVLEETPFDPVETVESTVGLLSSTALSRGVRLQTSFDPDTPRFAMGDSGRVAQVLLNLVSNAVKFTDEGGEVRIHLGSDFVDENSRELSFTVTDTGIGIEPEAIDRIFGSFTQAEASTSRRYGGSGLGLAIATQLCELMGGTLTVKSTLGQGSTFRASVVVREADRGDPISNRSAAIASTQAASEHGVATRLRVLVAEDNHVAQKVVIGQLKQLGYEADAVSNGIEAVHAASMRTYDVILMDLEMPEMDGLEAARLINEQAVSGARPVIIALTGHPVGEDRTAWDRSGMSGSIIKPVNVRELGETLDRCADGSARANAS